MTPDAIILQQQSEALRQTPAAAGTHQGALDVKATASVLPRSAEMLSTLAASASIQEARSDRTDTKTKRKIGNDHEPHVPNKKPERVSAGDGRILITTKSEIREQALRILMKTIRNTRLSHWWEKQYAALKENTNKAAEMRRLCPGTYVATFSSDHKILDFLRRVIKYDDIYPQDSSVELNDKIIKTIIHDIKTLSNSLFEIVGKDVCLKPDHKLCWEMIDDFERMSNELTTDTGAVVTMITRAKSPIFNLAKVWYAECSQVWCADSTCSAIQQVLLSACPGNCVLYEILRMYATTAAQPKTEASTVRPNTGWLACLGTMIVCGSQIVTHGFMLNYLWPVVITQARKNLHGVKLARVVLVG